MAYHRNFISSLVYQNCTVRFDNQVWRAKQGLLDSYRGKRVQVRRGVLGYNAEVVRQRTQADEKSISPVVVIAELYPAEI